LAIQDGLRRYAPDQRLLFVGPEGEPSTLQMYFMMSLLAYPRPVSGVFCGEPRKSDTYVREKMPRSDAVAGVIFYKTDPGQSAAGGTRLASGLYISPHSGADIWESFCR
jgi:hypothetical protein